MAIHRNVCDSRAGAGECISTDRGFDFGPWLLDIWAVPTEPRDAFHPAVDPGARRGRADPAPEGAVQVILGHRLCGRPERLP